ncbi:PREDICTED: NRT1/ PTR [Prunus dulcis]|uniref:PREDICTED: NRT1/ PTR n=1 Tax=Prunus dulcis TaxID=3755 RepID=A0A5E4FBX4_PRUDU|nr:PREDICTED: NRT1/ PTR [Prunus dulcis]
MVFATLCCITAAKVETRRLGLVESEGFVDKPTSLEIKTPEEDVDAEAIREDKKMYMKMFAQAVSGVGIICGVLSVYVVGEISAKLGGSSKVGGTSWFQYTLNKSHLDNYYWALAALTAANLGLGLLTLSTVEKILFYISLPLIAVGVSAYIAATLTPIGDQLKPLSSSSESEPLLVPAASESDNASTGTANAHWTAAMFENVLLVVLAVFLPVSALIAVGYIQVLHTKENKGTFILSSFTSNFYHNTYQNRPLRHSHVHHLHPLRRRVFNRKHFLHRASSRHEPLCWELVDSNPYPSRDPRVREEKLGGWQENAVLKFPKGFSDDATSIIPMTMFWLLPQYILLGLSEAFSEKCIAGFFSDELLPGANEGDEAAKGAKKKYIESVAQAVNGVGIILGVLIVYIVGEIQPTWFQSTVNKSRLDNYFWTLAALFAATLVLFGLFSCCLSVYEFKRRSTEDVEGNVTPATTTTTTT